MLQDSGFITEVHHITGEGEDGGVVYCEIQGRENTAESRVYLELLRTIYPGHCAYKSETGGRMKNLRESTDNVKVSAEIIKPFAIRYLPIMLILANSDVNKMFHFKNLNN